MKLIVGLGNPGRKYQHYRHNLGFMVLDKLLADLVTAGESVWQPSVRKKSLVVKVNNLVLAKPQTMMNASGLAVASLSSYFNISMPNIWVVHDDLDFPLGKIQVKTGGSAAGHRGLDSIISQLGSGDFTRFRLGIGRPGNGLRSQEEIDRYVLSPFKKGELSQVEKLKSSAVKAIRLGLKEGLERAMNEFN
jgi:PTH1 family peptidyl-tRNA hydrolase